MRGGGRPRRSRRGSPVWTRPTCPTSFDKRYVKPRGQFMFEPSFPMRIAALAERVGAVLPGCVGRVNRWKQAVTNQRNILAHGLPDEDCSFDVTRMHYITRSLRWTLTLYLLLEAGVPADQLASITANNRRYERDQRNWCRVWPKVFTDA